MLSKPAEACTTNRSCQQYSPCGGSATATSEQSGVRTPTAAQWLQQPVVQQPLVQQLLVQLPVAQQPVAMVQQPVAMVRQPMDQDTGHLPSWGM